LKRENKAYSYKEQLEELNLRKELEKQRLISGKVPQLTSKQKESMKIQLEKEAAIRQKLQEVFFSRNTYVTIIYSVCLALLT